MPDLEALEGKGENAHEEHSTVPRSQQWSAMREIIKTCIYLTSFQTYRWEITVLARTSSAWILSQTESFHAFLYVMGTRGSANLQRSSLPSSSHTLSSQPLAPRTTAEQSCPALAPTPLLCSVLHTGPWHLYLHCSLRAPFPWVPSCFVYLNLTSPGDSPFLRVCLPLSSLLTTARVTLPVIPWLSHSCTVDIKCDLSLCPV